jgi:alkanesulfonate monooxygenase SsuD/methylene tetrahydromethanopterin reductase-like flavin-dependent oxidoreductase (luciferase family)
MLELGIVLPNSAVVAGTASADDLLDMAQAADADDGWDYAWVGDSLFSVARLESVVLLSALAARTRRLRLGIGCLASLGLREPLSFALQWASLDVISGGRITLAACTGPGGGPAIERELALFGLTHREKVARMEAAVELLRGDGRVSDELELRPGFVQRPLPVWVVANPSATAGPKTVERVLGRVARLGDGWMTFGSSAELLRTRLDRLNELRQAAGRDVGAPFPVCAYVDVNVDVDEQRALRDATLTARREGRRNATPEALRRTAAIGSPERCLEFLAPLIEAGATNLALRPIAADPRAQLDLIGEHLVPHLKGSNRAPAPALRSAW